MSAHLCYGSGSEVVPNGSIYTAIPMNSEYIDTDGFHDSVTNNTRMTIPTGLGGVYLYLGAAIFHGHGGGFQNSIQVAKNGSGTFDTRVWITQMASTDNNYGMFVPLISNCSPGDYFETQALSNAPGCTPGPILVYLGQNPVACQAQHGGSQSIPSSTWTVVSLSTEVYDSGSLHDTVTNNSRITVPDTADYMVFITSSFLSLSNSLGQHRLKVDGVSAPTGWEAGLGQVTQALNGTGCFSSQIISLTAGQYVELEVFHNNGSSRNTDLCNIALVKIPSSSKRSQVYNSSSTSLINNTFTKLPFPNEFIDNDSMHSTVTNTGRIITTTAGKYLMFGQVRIADSSNVMWLMLRKNNSSEPYLRFGREGNQPGAISPAGVWAVDAAASDFWEIEALQDSGSSQNGDFAALGAVNIDAFDDLSTSTFAPKVIMM